MFWRFWSGPAERRALGIEYKDITLPELLQKVYERNLRDYGDALGPRMFGMTPFCAFLWLFLWINLTAVVRGAYKQR